MENQIFNEVKTYKVRRRIMERGALKMKNNKNKQINLKKEKKYC